MEVRTTTTDTRDVVLRALRKTRQIRSFTEEPVSEDDLHTILEVSRWTGSSMNTQPWQFIVVRDADVRRQIGEISVHARYVGKAPLAIAIAMPGEDSESDAYDEARVAERILIAASAMGLVAAPSARAPHNSATAPLITPTATRMVPPTRARSACRCCRQ